MDIHKDFLPICLDHLKTSYGTISALQKDQDSLNRLQQEAGHMMRVMTAHQKYVAKCDYGHREERAILPLGR